MKTLAYLVAGTMALAHSATADGAGDPFLGAYGGGQMGYLWLDSGAGASLPGGVGAGGIHIGYSRALSWAVVGFELEVDTQNRLFDDDFEVVKGMARLKIRAGGVRRGTFTYGVAGLSMADTTIGYGTGWTLGAGAEVPVSDRWRIGLEVLHDRIGNIGTSGTGLSLTTLNFRASYGF